MERIDEGRVRANDEWLSALSRAAEAFRVAMVESGALDRTQQTLYFPQLRALEAALNPINFRHASLPAAPADSRRTVTTHCNNKGCPFGGAALEIVARADGGWASPAGWPPDTELVEALRAAIRAANLALFVIRKQGVMPNSSWESGFKSDMKIAEDALSRAPTSGERT